MFWLPAENHCLKHAARDAEGKPRDRICGQAHSSRPVLFSAGLYDRACHLLPSPPPTLLARGSGADVSMGPSRSPGVRNVAAPGNTPPENGRTLINRLLMHLNSCSQRLVQD